MYIAISIFNLKQEMVHANTSYLGELKLQTNFSFF